MIAPGTTYLAVAHTLDRLAVQDPAFGTVDPADVLLRIGSPHAARLAAEVLAVAVWTAALDLMAEGDQP